MYGMMIVDPKDGWPNGEAQEVTLHGVTTFEVAPSSDGAVFEFTLNQPGNYPFMDLNRASLEPARRKYSSRALQDRRKIWRAQSGQPGR